MEGREREGGMKDSNLVFAIHFIRKELIYLQIKGEVPPKHSKGAGSMKEKEGRVTLTKQEKCQWTVEFLKDGIWRNKNGERKWGKKKAGGKGDIENYVSTL